MNKILAGLVLMMVPVFPASADNEIKPVITAGDCRRLVEHRQSKDTRYKPGVDVRGNKVAPAEVPAEVMGQPRIKLPDEYRFELTIDHHRLWGGAGADDPDARLSGEAGAVVFDVKSGRLTFAGKTLRGAHRQSVIDECHRLLGSSD